MGAAAPKDTSLNNKLVLIVSAVALCIAAIATGAWYREVTKVRDLGAQVRASELQPIASLLTDNQALLQELQSAPFAEKDSGIFESYLAKIRRDGVAKNADMKQRLDQLAENNTAIVTLIKAYAPRAKTTAFKIEADKFRNYASAWRDRWNSVMELFMAGGNYPVAGAAFPAAFPGAVQAEVIAIQ